LKLNNKNEKQIQQNWSHMKKNPTTIFIQLLRTEKFKKKNKKK